jgi:hypothetical protein
LPVTLTVQQIVYQDSTVYTNTYYIHTDDNGVWESDHNCDLTLTEVWRVRAPFSLAHAETFVNPESGYIIWGIDEDLLSGESIDNGVIDMADFSFLSAHYDDPSKYDIRADHDNDGDVDFNDLLILGANYGKTGD